MMRLFAATVFASFGLIVVGCGSADMEGDAIAGTFAEKSRASSKAGGGSDCDPNGLPTIEPHSPDEFPKCSTPQGSARCIPEAALGAFAEKVKGQAAQQSGGGDQFLATCDKGVCIPDDLVKTGGMAPKECTSLNGAGVCLDMSIPMVGQYKDMLPQDKCEANQRCAPCNNPLKGGEPTGACLIGRGPKPGETCTGGGAGGAAATPSKLACPYTGDPLVKVDTFAACGEGAHCVGTSLLPDAKMSALLKSCNTSDGKAGVCAPDEFIQTAGNFVPATCESILGAEGRCMNINVPQVEAQKDFLPQASCRSFERCTPCANPVDGKPTGACTQSCDKGPSKPPVTFSPCARKAGADMAGVCVPATIIPKEMQTFLKQGTCAQKSDKCAPKDVVAKDPTFSPTKCSGTIKALLGIIKINYSGGVCLADLIDTPGNRGNCLAGQECVPCTNPVSKKPTGAPGCGP